ncbi:virulence-associated E family protein [Pseudoflavonifractor capillosus]|uniref:virulence-associated E family protein n=1 Tax=Pseudoflavonifractor capillosus TaxID=106588 RepID=UPI0019576A15|nr:virulence-associated E family protein [Pseudoflavonifractor capillosus]MBM6680073.1 virulence-associated protein E [Pseudoflavonifractor capillosus]
MTNDRLITITVGASRRAIQWNPQTLLISELYEKLRLPARSTETMAQYLALSKGQQDDLKDVGGFVAGTLNGPRRKASAVTGRDVLTLDLDNIPAGDTESVCARVAALGYGYCIYSTRKHRPDAPRLRVLLPLDRACTADEYEPIARKVAWYIDSTMALFDPTTFEPSRLMYWPSCCADGQYVYYWDDKPMLSADRLLGDYADWRDTTAWPTIPGAVSPARLAAKQGDPLAKHGIVGAFCRTYDVPAAMDKFLPGLYEPTVIPGRYTYTGGSTTGGAVLYDNGKFLYSHHATDPCSGKLVNSFDLVRLHCFGGKDDEAQPDTPTNRLPSYTAMCELAAQDQQVSGLLLDERWRNAQAAFGPAGAPDPADDGSWRRPPIMEVDAQGKPVKSMKNLRTVLENDPNLKGKLQLNLFSGRIDVTGELPWRRPGNVQTFGDEDAAQLRIYLEPFFGKVAKNDVLDAVAACASDQAYHPVRDYLNSLQWDGVPRLDMLLVDYMGAENTPYIQAVTRKAFTAAVARVMTPGCKYDTMLVLIGGQGRYKSTLFRVMGGSWFSDSLRTFGDKDSMETIQGTWINEVAEMQALAKSEINAVKMFLSKSSDYYRAAYGRYTADRPRQCVFFGTSNTKECLTDTTGNRRFWPVDIDQQTRKKDVWSELATERDQLWAEAMVRWRLGESLSLPPALEREALAAQEAHRERHPWEGIIADFLEEEIPVDWPKWDIAKRQMWRAGGMKYTGPTAPRSRVCAAEIWCEALGKPKGDMRQREAREINGLLARAPGWTSMGPAGAGKPYGVQRCFERE